MAQTPAPPCAANKPSATSCKDEPIDVDALLEENDRLRNLVVQLSALVMRDVARRR
ncbi:MAG: hypothetical protein KDJ76_15860 [Xanthobacteraceae bacterium]|nr:hypothetical protein [Xanthobacteraceae bacterium]